MAKSKQILVLSGDGKSGMVKISNGIGAEKTKVTCSLDFNPKNATLYLIGSQISKITLNSSNTSVEVPFKYSDDVGCMLKAANVTMFGGSLKRSEMQSAIARYEKDAETALKREESTASSFEVKQTPPIEKEPDKTACEFNRFDFGKKKEEYVGAAVSESVNPLGEWTRYDGNNFYYAVKPQIDEMFICYPEEKLLNETVPHSKWVRVDAEDGCYVVGVMYEGDEPSFICYGVPERVGDKRAYAPKELENTCVWLPVNGSDTVAGYWIIYQSAKTGEIIR